MTEPIARSAPRSISIHTGVALMSTEAKSMLVKLLVPVTLMVVPSSTRVLPQSLFSSV
ncbi:hypothetical protein ABZ656_49015 [Streptomyces sp. NPDC007095]|uniref:hypothetical protein n=1 Tax=Streptomyces sp. NPDC007095 TaxID=3154482 RepID=UPI0033DF16DB